MKLVAMVACLLALPLGLGAVELVIEYPALQRILAQQIFTQEGRKYVRGTQKNRCDYAYLENPVIGADHDRLRVQAHFTGRTARGFLGACLGLGDAFDLVITTVPYYHDGMIGFRDVKVDALKRDGFYIRNVLRTMRLSFARDFQYRVLDDARSLLEGSKPGAPYSSHLKDFRVSQIRVTPAALVLGLEFGLVIQAVQP